MKVKLYPQWVSTFKIAVEYSIEKGQSAYLTTKQQEKYATSLLKGREEERQGGEGQGGAGRVCTLSRPYPVKKKCRTDT